MMVQEFITLLRSPERLPLERPAPEALRVFAARIGLLIGFMLASLLLVLVQPLFDRLIQITGNPAFAIEILVTVGTIAIMFVAVGLAWVFRATTPSETRRHHTDEPSQPRSGVLQHPAAGVDVSDAPPRPLGLEWPDLPFSEEPVTVSAGQRIDAPHRRSKAFKAGREVRRRSTP